jgi:hypothetical protein
VSPGKEHKTFTDDDSMASRIPAFGIIRKVISMDFKSGDTCKMSTANLNGQESLISLTFKSLITL